jgi:putative ABC transport system permease protein
LSFVVAGVAPGHPPRDVCREITARTGLAAYTTDEFKALTVRYFLKYTGIPVNFGTSVLLGFIVGIAIAGQTFHNFTLDNLRYFGTLKAMGAGNRTLLRMILLQALLVGALGYGLGVGAAATWGHLMRDTPIAFRMPWQLLLLSGVAVLLICLISAALSIRKVMKLEPAIVFR